MANVEAFESGFDAVYGKKQKKDKEKKGKAKSDNAATKPSTFTMAKPSLYKEGGTVRKTGMAKVHKGEKVLTAAQAKECASKKSGGKRGMRKRVASKG
jgi:hypothetical protein